MKIFMGVILVSLGLISGICMGWFIKDYLVYDGLPSNSYPQALKQTLSTILNVQNNNLQNNKNIELDLLDAIENRLQMYQRTLSSLRRQQLANSGLEVELQIIDKEEIRIERSFIGRLVTRLTYKIQNTGIGIIRDCQVKVGDWIKPGDPLCILDRSLQAGYTNSQIFAKEGGRIVSQLIEENQVVQDYTTLFEVVKPENLIIKIPLAETDVAQVYSLYDPQFRVRQNSVSNSFYSSTLRLIEPEAHPQSGMYTAQINLSDEIKDEWIKGKIPLDSFWDVYLVLEKREAIMIPERLIRFKPKVLLVDEQDVVYEKEIKIGTYRNIQLIEVTEGLQLGDRLIIGHNRQPVIGEQAFVNQPRAKKNGVEGDL